MLVDIVPGYGNILNMMCSVATLCCCRLDYKGGAFYSVATLPAEGVDLARVVDCAKELVDSPATGGVSIGYSLLQLRL